jgi:polygalacturonase
VKRPDGALPPEADFSPPGAGATADPKVVNPDQARIQAALDACGAAVNAEVGDRMAAAEDAARAKEVALADDTKNLAGASGEELAKIRPARFAVRLRVNASGKGDSFISGPLVLPSGVTLWIDKGATLFATRDAMAFHVPGRYCANTAVGPDKAGASSNCLPLIGGKYLVNSAIMGEGSIDSRAYTEIVTSNPLLPLMKTDMTCSNTYKSYEKNEQAPDGTPCDDGGTVVNKLSSSRNMTWWDLAFLGNMVKNGRTGTGSQSNFRMMVFDYVKNLTLYRITMNNSANFHCVPSGVDGLTVWGVKLQTPSNAAYANPAGNYNPLYNGTIFYEDNVKNTDAFDPASASTPQEAALQIGSAATSSKKMAFDGYLKNVVFAYNYISTGDDDIVLKGSRNPSKVGTRQFGIDGNRDTRSDRKWGIIIAHNHIYWGHGISIGSETNGGVANVHIYDNSFNGSEEAIRIKSDYARGGEVANIYYDKICARNVINTLLFTPYYSTRAITSPLVPIFHDIFIKDMVMEGKTKLRFEGFEENTGGFDLQAYPLVLSMENVVSTTPDEVTVTASEAKLTVRGVNLPIQPSAANRVELKGTPTQAVDPSQIVDCSHAFVDFPSTTSPFGVGWQ